MQVAQPLSTLVPSPEAVMVAPGAYKVIDGSPQMQAWNWGAFILWFIIIAVIVWLILYSLKPGWVLNPDGTVNGGKVLVSAIIIALIIIFIIWLIKAIAMGGSRQQGVANYVVV